MTAEHAIPAELLAAAVRRVLPERLVALHDDAADACRRNDEDKLTRWRAYAAEMEWWRYQQRLNEADSDEQERLRRRITPADGSPTAAIAALLAYCWLYGTLPAAGDPLYRLPRVNFVPYPYQELALAVALWLQLDPPDLGKDVAVLKSRQTGLTTAFLHEAVWRWHLEPTRLGVGSYAESEVDKNPGTRNPHTLLGRCEAIIAAEPAYLRPKGFDLADKRLRQMLEIVNPENEARIDGEPARENFTSGRTYLKLLVDELAKWPFPDAILASSGGGNVVQQRVTLSTPTGDAPSVEAFYQRVKEEWPHRYLEIDWWEHPERDAAWERAARVTLGDDKFGIEHELSFQASAERVIYPEWRSVPQGDFDFDPDRKLCGGIDFGRRDGTALVLFQPPERSDGGRVRILASHFSAGQTIEFYVPLMGGLVTSGVFVYSKAELEFIDLVQRWSRRAGGIAWFGDPAGEHLTQLRNESVVQILNRHGLYVRTNEKIRSHDERQDACRRLLRDCEVNTPLCRALDDSMRRYRWPKPNDRTTAGPRRQPVHRDSHLPTALEYAAVNRPLWAMLGVPAPKLQRHVAAYEVAAR